MTKDQINQITRMRERGEPYSAIAKALNLSQNTVKSYCSRHGIGTVRDKAPEYQVGDITQCEQCGAGVVQYSLKRRKRFCCDACRTRWWNEHPDIVNRKAAYQHTCRYCGKDRYHTYKVHQQICEEHGRPT